MARRASSCGRAFACCLRLLSRCWRSPGIAAAETVVRRPTRRKAAAMIRPAVLSTSGAKPHGQVRLPSGADAVALRRRFESPLRRDLVLHRFRRQSRRLGGDRRSLRRSGERERFNTQRCR